MTLTATEVADMRHERAMNGRCPGCGRRRVKSWCYVCRAGGRRRQRRRHDKMRALGLCRCGRKPKPGRKCCVLCINAATARKREQRLS